MRRIIVYTCIVTFSALLFFCKKTESEKPRWDMGIITPIVKSSLSFNQILSDTILQVNADNSLSLIHRQHLYSMGLDSLVKLKIKPYVKRKTVESLVLPPDTITYSITLRELSQNMATSDRQLLEAADGNVTLIPGMSGQQAGPVPINLSDLLKSAKIKSGELEMTINNGFPVYLSNITLQLNNNGTTNDLIFEKKIPSIAKKSSYKFTEDLSGKTVEGNMVLNIPSFNTLSSIDKVNLNDAITVTVIIRNVKVEEAVAVFPAQEIIRNEVNSPFEDMGFVKLTKARVKKGKIVIHATTTAPDTIYYTYSIPVAQKNGVPFELKGKVAPGANGAVGREDKVIDMAGYEIDLRGKNRDTINALYNIITARIENTGREVHFSLSDYIDINLGLEDLEPSYVEGFLGFDTIAVGPGVKNIDFFKEFESDNIKFSDLKVNLEIENGFGSKADFVIDYLSASRGNTEKTINNPASGVIAKATNNPVKSATTFIPLENTNPPAIDLFNLNPDKIGYSGKVYLNRGESENDLSGFASSDSKVNVWLNLDMPLKIAAKNLILRDTILLSPTTINTPISQGILNLLAWNGYPFDVTIKLKFLNRNKIVFDSLTNDTPVKAGNVDNATGRVIEKMYSKLSYNVDINKLNRLLQGEYIAIEVKFNSSPADVPAKIYTDYKIDLKLTGDFDYTVKLK